MLSNSHRQKPHVDQLYIAEVTQSIRFPSEHVGIIADLDTVLSTPRWRHVQELQTESLEVGLWPLWVTKWCRRKMLMMHDSLYVVCLFRPDCGHCSVVLFRVCVLPPPVAAPVFSWDLLYLHQSSSSCESPAQHPAILSGPVHIMWKHFLHLIQKSNKQTYGERTGSIVCLTRSINDRKCKVDTEC